MIYAIVILVLILCSYMMDGKEAVRTAFGKRVYDIDIVFVCIYMCLSLLMGLSRDLGGDKMVYIEYYEEMPSWFDSWSYVRDYILLDLLKGFMPLWNFLNITVKTFFPNSFVPVQIVHALFVQGAVMWFFATHTRRKYLAVLVFFFYRYFIFNGETMRESIAIAIFLIAFYFYEHRRIRTYYVICCLALGFHFSAIITFVFPLIPRFEFTVKRFIIAGMLALCIYLFAGIVLVPIADYVSAIGLGGRYNKYLLGWGNLNFFIGNFVTYMAIPWFGYYSFVTSNVNIPQWQNDVMKKYLLFATVLCALLGLDRFFEYFSVFCICVFAEFAWHFAFRRGHTFPWAFVVCVMVLFNAIRFFINPIGIYHRYDLYYPYTSIFDDTRTHYRNDIHYWATDVEATIQQE